MKLYVRSGGMREVVDADGPDPIGTAIRRAFAKDQALGTIIVASEHGFADKTRPDDELFHTELVLESMGVQYSLPTTKKRKK